LVNGDGNFLKSSSSNVLLPVSWDNRVRKSDSPSIIGARRRTTFRIIIKVVRQRVGPNKCQTEIIKSFGISRKMTSRNQFIGLYKPICFSERRTDDLLTNANLSDEQYSVHDDCRRSHRSEKMKSPE
jgi:hypothetical protein